jgi:hypothetical protein
MFGLSSLAIPVADVYKNAGKLRYTSEYTYKWSFSTNYHSMDFFM